MSPITVSWDAVEAIGTWFGGLATAGSLLLGFSILLRDRRKEEQRQADRVGYEFTWGLDQDQRSVARLSVYNTSDSPVFGVQLRYDFVRFRHVLWNYLIEREVGPLRTTVFGHAGRRGQPTKGSSEEEFDEDDRLNIYRWYLLYGRKVNQRIGTEIARIPLGTSAVIEGRRLFPSELYECRLEFRDAGNQSWERDLSTGRVRRLRDRHSATLSDLVLLVVRRARWRWRTGTWRA